MTTLNEVQALDLFVLKGEAKRQASDKLWAITQDKDENPSIIYEALMILENETGRRLKQLEIIKNFQQRQARELQEKALSDYKIKQKIEFMVSHKDDIARKNFTMEIVHGLEKLDKMDKYGCYNLHKLQVTQKDCETCPSKARCWAVTKAK